MSTPNATTATDTVSILQALKAEMERKSGSHERKAEGAPAPVAMIAISSALVWRQAARLIQTEIDRRSPEEPAP